MTTKLLLLFFVVVVVVAIALSFFCFGLSNLVTTKQFSKVTNSIVVSKVILIIYY